MLRAFIAADEPEYFRQEYDLQFFMTLSYTLNKRNAFMTFSCEIQDLCL